MAALAIAAAALADPAMTRARAVTPPLTIAAIGNEALVVAHHVAERLPSEYAPVTRVHDRLGGGAACPSEGVCVLVAGEMLPDRLTSGAVVAGAVRAGRGDAAIIEHIASPRRVSLHSAAVMRVTLRAAARVEIFDGDMLVGAADGQGGAALAVTWAPVAEGIRRLRIVAGDDICDVAVDVDARRLSVLTYEPETTWLGTFVRRAVQNDVRFAVSGRTQVAPPVAITRGAAAALSSADLDTAAVVVVSAADQLRTNEVDLLERFVASRGGSLVVLLDRHPAGPILRLLPRIAGERIEREPRAVGALRAGELVSFVVEPGTTAIDRDEQRAVTVVRHLGHGRVVVSGALDAWRHRDATTAFDTYWTGLIWDAAVAAGAALDVTAAPLIARPGQAIHITAEQLSMEPLGDELTASARYECADERGVVRLWPAARRGAFIGTLAPSRLGECVITAAVGGQTATTRAVLLEDFRTPQDDEAHFLAAVSAHGGVVVTDGQTEPLRQRLRALLPSHDEPRTTYPMRSALWIVPFAGCLCGEWFLRRRAALR